MVLCIIKKVSITSYISKILIELVVIVCEAWHMTAVAIFTA